MPVAEFARRPVPSTWTRQPALQAALNDKHSQVQR